MAINLLNNSITGMQQGVGSAIGQTSESGGTSALMRQAANAILKEVSGLIPGDTIQGQLVSKDGSNIELLLGNNTRLSTMLEKDMNLSLGQLMSFEVGSNKGGQLTLRPLFANMSNSTTIMSALDAAGIPASDSSVKMVDTLMQNGMPINKDMLHTVNRELSMYPDADVMDIVMLHKMDIPVNEGNVRQMHLYNNNNQWMLDNVGESASELTDILMDAAGGDKQGLNNLLGELKTLLPPAEEEPGIMPDGTPSVTSADPKTVMTDAAGRNMQAVNDGLNGQVNASSDEMPNMTQMSDSTGTTQSAVLNDGADGKVIYQDVQDIPAAGTKSAESLSATDTTGNIPVKESDAGIKETANPVNDLKAGQESVKIDKTNVFEKLAELDKSDLAKPEIRAQVRDAVSDLIKDNFLMNPKDIKEEKYVAKYYERTMQLADNLERLLADNGKGGTEFAKTMANVKENTTFMNHVNDMYNYVQLPLKMNESQANGDLYVYARKKGKNAVNEDGKMTALLHLNMDHLGAMDIFLTLSEGNKLNTKFTLEKEEMIDFIASHIDELNARLQKKGYNAGTVVLKKDEPDKTAIENIVGNKENILLSTQSFDARA